MSQVLYRKWRPRRWDEIVGQDHIVQTLRNSVASERIAHAYLFAGPRGTGKTTTARVLAKAVNCLHPDAAARPCDQCEHCQAINAGRFLDLIEIDAASNTSVEDVRDLREKVHFAPNQGRYKVYVIDEVHMLSTAAFNALLKTLEEPPPHAIFVLATTEAYKIPATVLSRCQRHEFRRVSVAEIVKHLSRVAEWENLQVAEAALTLIARQATGSLRDALSLLDQLASSGSEITLEKAQLVLGTATTQAVLQVIDALLAGEASAGLECIHQALDAGSDPRQFARQIINHLRNVLLIQSGNVSQVEAPPEERAHGERHAQALSSQQVLQCIYAFNQAATNARAAWHPALPLEMAFLEALNALSQGRMGEGESPSQSPARAAPASTPTEAKPSPSPEVAQRMPNEAASPPQVVSETPSNQESEQDKEHNVRLKECWQQVLQQVRAQNPNLYGLLNSCKARYIRGNVLYLAFASEIVMNKIAKRENLEIVERVISQNLGSAIRVRCTVSAARHNTIPPEVDSNGMVATAVRDLGGEIVDIQ